SFVAYRTLRCSPPRRSSDLARGEIHRRRPAEAEQIQPDMVVEAAILYRDHRLRKVWGKLGDPHRHAVDVAVRREKPAGGVEEREDRKSTRLNSSHAKISYAV